MKICANPTFHLSNSRLFLVSAFVLFGSNFGYACVVPQGIGTCSGCVDESVFSNIPMGNTFGAAIQTVLTPRPGLVGLEAPIQSHMTSTVMMPVYGAAAAFHPTATDSFGRQTLSDSRRRCDATASGMTQTQWDLNRQVTIMYCVLWGMGEGVTYSNPPGSAEAEMRNLAAAWGINYDVCDEADGCDSIDTPWGLCRAMIDEALDFISRDGWNKKGTLMGEENRIPYSDWREGSARYKPKNSPWDLWYGERWQPILEHDGNGFITFQEHVTPHIGESARSRYLGDDDICTRTKNVADPKYNLQDEAELTLAKVANLTDNIKAEIEFFDNKFLSLLPLQVQQFVRMGINTDDFEFIKADTVLIETIREATIVVWRSKVEHDLIRPPSYIHDYYGDTLVYSYSGPELQDNRLLKGKLWQPYKSVMPHSEFPSGSACICEAFAEAMIDMGGADNITGLLNGPLVHDIAQGSSRVEKGKPAQAEQLIYSSWTQISERCRETRLEGGMHFTKSIEAGKSLCAGIGSTIAQTFLDLENGLAPTNYLVDFDDSAIVDKRHCPGKSGKKRRNLRSAKLKDRKMQKSGKKRKKDSISDGDSLWPRHLKKKYMFLKFT